MWISYIGTVVKHIIASITEAVNLKEEVKLSRFEKVIEVKDLSFAY